jgi:L-seryl-tRNA(Ser) seleniumtransferase
MPKELVSWEKRVPDERPRGSDDLGVRERLRRLPSVEGLAAAVKGPPHHVAVAAAQAEVEALRARVLGGEDVDPDPEALREAVARRAARVERGGLRRVINATGVVLHTNLGRAPLAPVAAAAAAEIAGGYSNLEYDLDTGARGSRQAHIEPLLCELSGAEAAIAVNNNAAAVLLALAATATGREVTVSRGQLIEIGDSFRIPEILAQSGAKLVEVGTTNCTQLADYEAAVGDRTGAILRVHQSNFRTIGFTEEVALRDLRGLADQHGLSLIDDLGSGALEALDDERLVRESVAAGADLVCFSADKLLGGPQGGVIVGTSAYVERCRKHPLARALRLDKLQLAALEATLRLHRDGGPTAIPALTMLRAGEQELLGRAERLAQLIGGRAHIVRAASRAGGGSLPLTELEGPVCVVDPGDGADAVVERLREADPPVIARIAKGSVLLDPRTLTDEEVALVAQAVRDAFVGDG